MLSKFICNVLFLFSLRTFAMISLGLSALSHEAKAELDYSDIANGPFISRPDVVSMLDRSGENVSCEDAGPLAFVCLIQKMASPDGQEPNTGSRANPFKLDISKEILSTIQSDISEYERNSGSNPNGKARVLNPDFLKDSKSRLQLVGLVNRMDRVFITDDVNRFRQGNHCGEISAIYRFEYESANEKIKSRLPVTMNVIFPALPHGRSSEISCQDIAQRWRAELKRENDRSAAEIYNDLVDTNSGIVSLIDGRQIERIELNMQVYRIPAGADRIDLGSPAEYLIRVFRWDKLKERFVVSFLTNQIDRARILAGGKSKGDLNSCDPGIEREISRDKFVNFVLNKAITDVDAGSLNIPKEFLACRAVTSSPGGLVRSGNDMLSDIGVDGNQRILNDDEIADAIKRAQRGQTKFSFIKSPTDFRMRLRGLSCSGCHQARAIAGFHFPGADRQDTPSANAVFLPGSPHFYGDQARRLEVLDLFANGEDINKYRIAPGYASRPQNKRYPILKHTQIIGGWGGACLMTDAIPGNKREWGCKGDLKCTQVFKSSNAPGMGICLPSGRNNRQIGDPLQRGTVISKKIGLDKYQRVHPEPTGDWSDRWRRDTRIDARYFPDNPPSNNEYYGAHQEFYLGVPKDQVKNCASRPTLPEREKCFRDKRDRITGGFPAGMLRLSECKNLPNEATCALVASSGFNTCLGLAKNGYKTLDECFVERTSYSGLRACDIANPCRDDYICLRPLGYTLANADSRHSTRRKAVKEHYNLADFGQKKPDQKWLGRNNGKGDHRGICIPPYFVFQFRVDGHPDPSNPQLR